MVIAAATRSDAYRLVGGAASERELRVQRGQRRQELRVRVCGVQPLTGGLGGLRGLVPLSEPSSNLAQARVEATSLHVRSVHPQRVLEQALGLAQLAGVDQGLGQGHDQVVMVDRRRLASTIDRQYEPRPAAAAGRQSGHRRSSGPPGRCTRAATMTSPYRPGPGGQPSLGVHGLSKVQERP
jgi:hypothetical protein